MGITTAIAFGFLIVAFMVFAYGSIFLALLVGIPSAVVLVLWVSGIHLWGDWIEPPGIATLSQPISVTIAEAGDNPDRPEWKSGYRDCSVHTLTGGDSLRVLGQEMPAGDFLLEVNSHFGWRTNAFCNASKIFVSPDGLAILREAAGRAYEKPPTVSPEMHARINSVK